MLFTKCCTFCFFILSIFISSSVVFAASIFVPDDYDTIQDAINASENEDTVSVADGTYHENILFPGSKTITLISENGAVSTVIDGGDNGSVVTFPENSNSTLDGFTITNGSTSANGGGVLCGQSSTPTIKNCIITGNVAYAGGGISCGDSSAPFIINSIIEDNSVTGIDPQSYGGGIHASTSSTPTITNCIIKNNISDRNGGGLAFNTAEPTIVNCTFSNNTAAVNGGAISFENSAPIITNCTFSNNSASGNGGAIACSSPKPETAVANSILWGDSPNEIACDSATISVTYSDIQGEPTWPGTGNINADPKFVDEENGDFHLTNDSSCIDAGDNSALALPATDIDGDDRKIDDPAVDDTGNGDSPIVDMGAYELNCNVVDCSNNNVENPTYPTVAFTGDGSSSDGCFIATAAYGSYMEPQVITLRQFRDEHLLTNKLGTKFVEAYYQYSPPIANYIAEHDGSRTIARAGIAPLVGFSWIAMNYGMMIALAVLLSMLAMIIGGTCIVVNKREAS
jgi:predicted outer membrane repeat protein